MSEGVKRSLDGRKCWNPLQVAEGNASYSLAANLPGLLIMFHSNCCPRMQKCQRQASGERVAMSTEMLHSNELDITSLVFVTVHFLAVY